MIHCITGKPGGGKSLHAVRLICEYLRRMPTLRVVTNLPLRMDRLNEHLQGCHVLGRVRLLREDEVRTFWRYRGYRLGSSGELLAEVVGRPVGDTCVFEAIEWPVLYVLDEAHIYWNAREWAKTGKEALWYLSQHRHFGDTVIWVTQYTGNVDKQFRVLTHDYTVCRNWGHETFRGFRLPSRFRVEVSQEPPDVRERTVSEVRHYRHDASLWALYDTTAGAGLPGGLPPEPPPRRRPSVVWLAVSVVALVGVVVVALPYVASGAVGGLTSWLLGGGGAGRHEIGRPEVSPVRQRQSDESLRVGLPSPEVAAEPQQRREQGRQGRVVASWQLPDGRVFRAVRYADRTVILLGDEVRVLPER